MASAHDARGGSHGGTAGDRSRRGRGALSQVRRARLLLFGTAGTEHFDEANSDIDLLVEFDAAPVSRFDAYFGLKEDLEGLLGRPVDLVSTAALENPYLAKSIASTGRELLAA